ncbi:MAG: hypothetical protein KF709_07415 [Gemmatimonadaceae bacterium]|nr:hypothetical protein [Gemmatimonadaceae bacterium]
MARHCASCGAALGERGAFCHRCGAARDGAASAARGTPASAPAANALATILPWSVAGIALLALLAFVVGQQFGGARRASTAATPVAATAGRAPDISQMGPQERADRLFQRVMTYVSEGKSDSVTFFAPMAIQSFEALAPLNAHQRYDLGLLGLVSGDGELALAQADSILATQPSHLLGLILGMRANGLLSNIDARARFAARLSAALVSERAKALPEYEDHAPDIDAAVREADGRTPLRQ